MRYILLVLALVSANVYSDEVVFVKKQKDILALKTSCNFIEGRVLTIKTRRVKEGSKIFIKTTKGWHGCTIEDIVKVTV